MGSGARIHVYTGEGEGKTIAALGLALRAVGHGKRVVIIQFMKGRKDIGEYKIMKRLRPHYEIHQFGRKQWVNLRKPAVIDKKLAKDGLEFANKALKKKPDVLVLEEINLAVCTGLLSVENVVSLLKSADKKTLVVMTGRRAPGEFIKIADLVTEMRLVKHPFRKGVKAAKGVEY